MPKSKTRKNHKQRARSRGLRKGRVLAEIKKARKKAFLEWREKNLPKINRLRNQLEEE